MMFGTEKLLYTQLCKLKNEYGLQGIKAEFEAEGASFRDIMRLRRLTSSAGVKLHIKIGGVEALRDIKDAIEIGVDGVIAPMVESVFGAKKFYEGIKKFYKDTPIHTTLNIETKTAIDNLSEILAYASGKFSNINIGRSDLSASFLKPEITPESEQIYTILSDVICQMREYALTLGIGGGLSRTSIQNLNTTYASLKPHINQLETRKVILPTQSFCERVEAIKEALKFEELYILSKKEFSDLHIDSEIARLPELKRRMS
ncbi:aldolase/citrate lyase family protein [uncultured Helicobacter sp.]|uniref:aldolase/citrate lyase family protein n=1 Tax=uncultured Helicobacter sp. TaxID=175537 RepID=UPI001C3B3449|nr:hypothetical protein [Candidatus Helicobacter avicola]